MTELPGAHNVDVLWSEELGNGLLAQTSGPPSRMPGQNAAAFWCRWSALDKMYFTAWCHALPLAVALSLRFGKNRGMRHVTYHTILCC
jgi:hypothetical protein